MGQAFLRGQSGKIDFSKFKRQLVYSDWARDDYNSEIPFSTTGIGIYEIAFRSAFWAYSSTSSVTIMNSDGTSRNLSGYLGRVRSSPPSPDNDVLHVTIVVKDNGNGTYSVYSWSTSTGAYTLITDTAVAIKVVDSSAILLLVTRLYE